MAAAVDADSRGGCSAGRDRSFSGVWTMLQVP